MAKIKRFLKKYYLHIICITITLGFIACAVWVFPNAFLRVKDSFVDLWNSIKFYFKELFDLDIDVDVTVNNYSNVKFTPFLNLPETWEEFVVNFKLYWKTWATSENMLAYLSSISNFLYYFTRIVLLVVVPVILLLFILFKSYMSKHNNNYNKDSKPLTFYKWLISKISIPVKNFLKSFFDFVKTNKIYFRLWLLIWAWNFNFIAILVEFLAFYFYFVASFDFKNIYRQVYKLFCDLSVMIAFIPPFAWFILAYVAICYIRKKIGFKRLQHMERKDCGFINERPIVLMVCGTMGKKKTTAITDMALSEETMLKDKAFEKILENDLKFPYFTWCNFENAIKEAMKRHEIYNLATCKVYIKNLANYFYMGLNSDNQTCKSIRRHLRKKFNLRYKNLIFDYDFTRYGLFYDDKLSVVDIWQVLETYAQLYFVYIIQSSLIISNYSVRTDNLFDDLGNFPMWNMDFFKRDSKLIDAYSRHSHIIDFDALRLGRKIIENNPKKDTFEFGVVNITEIGKERKNQLELKETKKNEVTTNQKNDGFTDWLKMIRHSATIDNYPFVKVISDEQRPESLGADARDLLDIVHIRETSEIKLAMPLFFVSELIYSFVFSKFASLYYRYRYVRSDNTLLMYLLKSFISKFNHYYKGIYNTFGYCTLRVQVESGTQDGQIEEKKYYLMSKKIYSKRFSTDCFSEFFNKKSLQSNLGIEDLKEYGTEKATFVELKEQNSYFINDLINKERNMTDKDWLDSSSSRVCGKVCKLKEFSTFPVIVD